MSERQPTEAPDAWAGDGAAETMRQMASLLSARYAGLDVHLAANGRSFQATGEAKGRGGILNVRGEVIDDAVIALHVELLRAPQDVRVSAGAVFDGLSSLTERCRIVRPEHDPDSGETSLWVELKVHASPMSMARESAFASELERLDALACSLRSELPMALSCAELEKQYKGVSEFIEAVPPWSGLNGTDGADLLQWARETLELLDGAASVAVASNFAIDGALALAAFASVGEEFEMTFGQLRVPMINAKGLVDLAQKAPGALVVPAVRISLGTNPYDLANEMQALLSALSALGRPAVFTGSHGELQATFSGGQGGASDPLRPIVRRVPEVDMRLLIRFALQLAGRRVNGLPAAVAEGLAHDILDALQGKGFAEQKRLLPLVAARSVTAWSKGAKAARPSAAAYVRTACELTETLAGLSPRPRAARSAEVQERYTQTLTDPCLLAHLEEHLLAQDWALGQLVSRLRMECLTRPAHQPCRYCAQGTPGTGKSESAVLLAARLGIPYINIDAASMPDYYSAAAQLLGSGRGIVGSYQSGRLEQAAKHHQGALVEVSDLDHAVVSVRSALADLFLQVLETGEGQSASGAMFSCANVIFAFTMNLPHGMDEGVRKRIGFGGPPSRREIGADVATEIRHMLSGAFLSRVGTPIVFEPLDGAALAIIVERAVCAAVRSAAHCLHLEVADVRVEQGVGAYVVASLDTSLLSFGARALLEHGRMLAAQAFLEFQQSHAPLANNVLRVRSDPNGRLSIQVV